MHNPRSGNVVVFVLIAVMLFAALAYTFMRGSREGTGNLTTQQAKIAAQEVMSFGTELERTVNKLRQRGCSETQFDFYNTNWMFVNTTLIFPLNHNASAVAGCSVFGADGNMTANVFPIPYFEFTTLAGNNSQFGHSRVFRISIPGVGVASSEEMAYSLGRLKQSICLEINKQLGITALPTYTTVNAVNYAGAFGTSSQMTFTSNPPGTLEFCGRSDTSGTFNFWRVLIAR